MTACAGLQGAARGGKRLRRAANRHMGRLRGCARLCAAVRGLCGGCAGAVRGCAAAVRGCTGTNMCCQLHAAALLCMVEVSEGKSPSVTA